MKSITAKKIAELSRKGRKRDYAEPMKLAKAIRAEHPTAGAKTICTLLSRAGFDVPINTVHCWIYNKARGKTVQERIADLERERDEARAMVAELEQRDRQLMTKLGTFKGTGNVELDACLQERDPAFDRFRNSLPPTYWARYDISAVRLGWHFGRQSCPDAARMAEHACANRRACWEPCGELGNSADFVKPAPVRDAGPTPFQGRMTRREE